MRIAGGFWAWALLEYMVLGVWGLGAFWLGCSICLSLYINIIIIVVIIIIIVLLLPIIITIICIFFACEAILTPIIVIARSRVVRPTAIP